MDANEAGELSVKGQQLFGNRLGDYHEIKEPLQQCRLIRFQKRGDRRGVTDDNHPGKGICLAGSG